MLNFAHRGFSGKYPQNTMLAFEKAVEAGADGIELDVHFSKDKELVIVHDHKLDNICNVSGYVKDFTLEELKSFDASSDFKGVYGVNRIPTLREYFDFIKPIKGFITNIEMKTGGYPYIGLEKAVNKMIIEYGLEDRVIISSFCHESIMLFKEINPEIKCGFLDSEWLPEYGKLTREGGVECIHPLYTLLDEDNVREAKDNGIELNTWTVNDEESVRRLYDLGVDSVIGNYPDMAKKVIDSLK